MKFMHFAIASALAITPAYAHSDTKPRHGGQVVEVGETAFELVRTPAGVSLYVRDDGDDVPAASMTAKLIVTTGARKSEIPLVAAKGSQFFAKGAKIPAGSRVGVLIINKQSQARQSATFNIK
ncbi:hypothetical protein M9978_13620 [Sphingomonas sp. MG17]|uniref:Uncharacterized protein n=1 Tax=Sphingomonas tagetis TaxID=2949092 RepID=A0A9X2HJX2_9SPHN|nr:hypothetical protein [Sphingomonas tagetis]MCP3731462.1 hypothetical protein [Sphingomonas tagetis]